MDGDNPGEEPYADSSTCVWIIDAAGPIYAVFKSLRTETGYDIVSISNGGAEPLLFSGTLNQAALPPPFNTNSSNITVSFRSDAGLHYSGFVLELYALIPGGTWSPSHAPTGLPTWTPGTTAPDAVVFECDGSYPACKNGSITWSCTAECFGEDCGVDLFQIGLIGTIPPELGDLRCANLITVLSVWENKLEGTIGSWIGKLKNLKYLVMSSNRFHGTVPAEIGKLSDLEDLSIGVNMFEGTIGHWIGGLSKLSYLTLHQNRLSGTLTEDLGKLTNLVMLEVSKNRLVGTIGHWLGQLSKLRFLRVSFNEFTGTVPAEIGSLLDLEDLSLDSNRFEGKIDSWAIDLLKKLSQIILARNNFDGPIGNSIGELSLLLLVDIQGNRFEGTIPQALAKLPAVREINLANNRLSGDIPASFWANPNLAYLSLNGNQFSGFELPKSQGTCCLKTIAIGPSQGAGEPLYAAADGYLRPYENKSVPTADITACAADAADPGQRTNEDPPSENGFTFKLEVTSSCQAGKGRCLCQTVKPYKCLNVIQKERKPWAMNLSIECCTTCATESALETVDLSYNQLRGPSPNWLEQMLKGTIRQLDLRFNQLTGDYTSLAGLPTDFVRANFQDIVTVRVTPQQDCSNTTYRKANALQHDLGSCELIPPTTATVVVQAREVATFLQKPSAASQLGNGKFLTVVLHAEGGRPFVPHYAVSMVHTAATSAERISSKAWPALNHQALSLNGVHLGWLGEAPSLDSVVELNASIGRFKDTREYSLIMYADCSNCASGSQPCVSDGDTVETVLMIGNDAGAASERSEVHLTSQIQALPSIAQSTAKLMAAPGVLYTDAESLSVEVTVVDIDGLPIRYTTPEIVVLWGSSNVSMTTVACDRVKENDNRFVAFIPKSLRAAEADYKLQVSFKSAVGPNGTVTECIMLEAVVRINSKSEFNTIFVLIASCCGCVLLLAGTLLLLRKHMKALQGVVVTVFGEVGKFVLHICFEIGDLITDIITSHKVIFVSGFVNNEPLRLAFIAVIILGIVFSLAAFGLRIALAKSMSKSIMEASAPLPDDGSFRARATAIRRRSIDVLVGSSTLEPNRSSVSALTFDDSLGTLLRQLHWEKKKIARDLRACGITLLTMFFEDVPMLILQTILILGAKVDDSFVLISLLVSALMTGSKAHSFVTIPRLIYRREELSRIIAQFERMDRKMQDLQGQNQLKHGCEEDSSSHC